MKNVKTTEQYRVAYTANELVNGNFADVKHSSKWFDNLESCKQYMNKDNAQIITRLYEEETFQDYKNR